MHPAPVDFLDRRPTFIAETISRLIIQPGADKLSDLSAYEEAWPSSNSAESAWPHGSLLDRALVDRPGQERSSDHSPSDESPADDHRSRPMT